MASSNSETPAPVTDEAREQGNDLPGANAPVQPLRQFLVAEAASSKNFIVSSSSVSATASAS